jgi:hypothetical protein
MAELRPRLPRPKRKRASRAKDPADRKKMGRPPYVATQDQRGIVAAMRANGTPVRIIARNIGVHFDVLRREFREELAEGKAQIKAVLGASVIRAGINGDWRAAIAWLRVHGGPEWQNVERRLIGGIPGSEGAAPIPLDVNAKVTVYLPDNGRRNITIEGEVAAATAAVPVLSGGANDAC